MERYSAWRDSSTGILPFVVPVHPASDASNVVIYILWPMRMALATLRMALFAVLLGLMWALQAVIAVLFFPARSASKAIRDSITAIFLRTMLAVCFGFYWISDETVSSLRRTNASARASTLALYRERPQAGDLIIANWSSAIDIIWLAYRYQPIFVLPNVAAGAPTAGGGRQPVPSFRRASFVQMLGVTGKIPSHYRDTTATEQSLEAILKTADRPVVLLPEGCTSNNRGLLRFCSLATLKDVPATSRAFLVGIRYDAPSLLLPTATIPIPSDTLTPAQHLFRVATTPLLPPRTMTVKTLLPLDKAGLSAATAELPSLTSDEFWTKAANTLGNIGKLKLMNIGWEEKEGFLEYYNRKPGSLSAAAAGTAARASTPTKGRAPGSAARRRQL